jgi:protoheme IX farnesyltransferase
MVETIRSYADLTKYKLSAAVTLSAVTGYFLSGNKIEGPFFLVAAGVFFLSSGSAAMNQYTESVTDSIMKRTSERPIPSKKIPGKNALLVSVFFFAAGSTLLLLTGLLPFLLGALNAFLYNVVYTRLKKITPLSIIPGALVGAIPPLIGFTASGASYLNTGILGFSLFMFLWQLPHFWLIIIKYGEEYNAAGFATIAKYLNDKQIRNLIFIWVLFSTCLIFLFFIISDIPGKALPAMFLLLNVTFILLFHRLLFASKYEGQIRGAFILINSFSLLIMFLFIAASLLKFL